MTNVSQNDQQRRMQPCQKRPNRGAKEGPKRPNVTDILPSAARRCFAVNLLQSPIICSSLSRYLAYLAWEELRLVFLRHPHFAVRVFNIQKPQSGGCADPPLLKVLLSLFTISFYYLFFLCLVLRRTVLICSAPRRDCHKRLPERQDRSPTA